MGQRVNSHFVKNKQKLPVGVGRYLCLLNGGYALRLVVSNPRKQAISFREAKLGHNLAC